MDPGKSTKSMSPVLKLFFYGVMYFEKTYNVCLYAWVIVRIKLFYNLKLWRRLMVYDDIFLWIKFKIVSMK